MKPHPCLDCANDPTGRGICPEHLAAATRPTLEQFAKRVADYCNDPSLVREAEAILRAHR